MVLLEECIEVLKADSEIFFDKKNDKLFENFESLIDFNEYGRIDWGKYPNRKIIKESDKLLDYFDSEYCYIFWNDESLPVIKTKFNLFLKNIDDVLAVSYDTWILSNSEKIIIEFFHDDIISVINIPAPASL